MHITHPGGLKEQNETMYSEKVFFSLKTNALLSFEMTALFPFPSGTFQAGHPR